MEVEEYKYKIWLKYGQYSYPVLSEYEIEKCKKMYNQKQIKMEDKTEETLREKFKTETNKYLWFTGENQELGFSDNYVKWLEKKVLNNQNK